jgi:hypothetical protein
LQIQCLQGLCFAQKQAEIGAVITLASAATGLDGGNLIHALDPKTKQVRVDPAKRAVLCPATAIAP